MLFNNLLIWMCAIGGVVALAIEPNEKQPKTVEETTRRVMLMLNKLNDQLRVIRRNNPMYKNAQEANSITLGLLATDWDLTEELRYSARELRQTPSASLLEGTNIITHSTSAPSITGSVTDGWIAVKPMVRAAGRINDVTTQLRQHLEATADYYDALINKLPFAGQPIGASFKQSHVGSIERTIAEYEKAPVKECQS